MKEGKKIFYAISAWIVLYTFLFTLGGAGMDFFIELFFTPVGMLAMLLLFYWELAFVTL